MEDVIHVERQVRSLDWCVFLSGADIAISRSFRTE